MGCRQSVTNPSLPADGQSCIILRPEPTVAVVRFTIKARASPESIGLENARSVAQ